MLIREYLFFIILIICPLSAYSSAQTFIFGGGPNAIESQVSIELNTLWVTDIFRRKYPERQLLIHFSDGNASGLDVRSRLPNVTENKHFQPLARVFGVEDKNRYLFYSSKIAEDVQPSDSASIKDSLIKMFSDSRAGDEYLLIYQGHGGYRKNTNKNHFRLWGDSKIDVVELEAIMSQANRDAAIRFIFPQCFSGAFTRSIYKNADVDKGLAKGLRCGFVAQREDRESEGCTDSVNTSSYRDYTSYFFSAIDGRGIDGAPIKDNPDRNHDGNVTMLEAHYYTLKNGFSVDYSRSTSQDYLEQWQPWYLHWLPIPRHPDNVYSEIAEYIAHRFNVVAQGNGLIPEVSSRLEMLTSAINKLEREQEVVKKKIETLQKNIKRELAKRWPSILAPYTAQFSEILKNNINDIGKSILAHADYEELVHKQERSDTVKIELLDANREFVQMQKILWMRKLARIYDQFQYYASDRERQEYQKLVQCEDVPL